MTEKGELRRYGGLDEHLDRIREALSDVGPGEQEELISQLERDAVRISVFRKQIPN